jgi:hypothetical protein
MVPLEAFCTMDSKDLDTPRLRWFGPRGQVVTSLGILQPLNKTLHARILGNTHIGVERIVEGFPRGPRGDPDGIGRNLDIESER